MSETPENTLEQQALKRQERLKSLKRKITEKSGDDSQKNDSKLPAPKFRSYKPQDEKLTEHVLKKPEIPDVTGQVKNLLELSKSNMVIDQLDIANLAPRQPDWDLKRDVAKKLEKLEKRTQKAMAELIREKLKEKQDLADIAAAPPESLIS